MATEAAAEDNKHMSRSTSREHKNSVRSASHHGKRKQTDNGKLRSKSFAPHTTRSRNKEQRKSGLEVSSRTEQLKSASEGSRRKEQLKSASEGSRRKAVQHNLKEMKNLEGSKREVGSGSHRGEAIHEGKLRSKSFAPHTSHTRNKQQRESGSEGRRSTKQLKSASYSHRSDSVQTCRALFDRTWTSDDNFAHLNCNEMCAMLVLWVKRLIRWSRY